MMREFPNPKALQDYVKLHKLTYLWEGTGPYARRFAQLSPEQCEVASVATRPGTARALLFPRAILLAELEAQARPSMSFAVKRQRLPRGRPKKAAERDDITGSSLEAAPNTGWPLKMRGRWPPPCSLQGHEWPAFQKAIGNCHC